jgi:hypothetical protein
MLSKLLFGAIAAIGVSAGYSASTSTKATSNCCSPGAVCCDPPQACCFDAAKPDGCCTPAAECCNPPKECCFGDKAISAKAAGCCAAK